MKDYLCAIFQYLLSSFLNLACIYFCGFGILHGYAIMKSHPAILFAVLLICLVILAYIEGLHFGIVSAQHLPILPHSSLHRATRIQEIISKDQHVIQRFLIGRQLCVIITVFVIAEITTFPGKNKLNSIKYNKNILLIIINFIYLYNVDWPYEIYPYSIIVLFRCGLPGILLTLTFGQLLPQLLCEEFTLQFLNLPGCYSMVQIGLFIESLGISHFSWLLFRLCHINCSALWRSSMKGSYAAIPDFMSHRPAHNIDESLAEAMLADNTTSLAPVKSMSTLEIFKFIYSSLLILSCIAVIVFGILNGYSVLHLRHPALLFLLLFLAMFILFYLEGLMISIVSTQRQDLKEYISRVGGGSLERAAIIHEICNTRDARQGKMNNVKRFIMGRQFLTVSMVFLISQITVFPSWRLHKDIGDAGAMLFYFTVKTGLPGALLTLTVSQLLPQLLSSEHPWLFMNAIGSFTVVIASLATEAIGVTHFSRLLFHLVERLVCGRNESMFDDAGSLDNSSVGDRPNIL